MYYKSNNLLHYILDMSPTSRTARTWVATTRWQRDVVVSDFTWRTVKVKYKDYLMWIFTDDLWYHITDEDGNRIIIFDSTWYEKVDYYDRIPRIWV